MITTQTEINRDSSFPAFVPPVTVSEARNRIAELNSAIKSIEDQIYVRELSDNLDPAWLKKATTSQRFKTLERDKLLNWIEDRSYENSHGKNINDFIVAVVREDYTDQEWEGVLLEAHEVMGIGG